MADDFTELPSGLKILASDPVGDGGDALNENFTILDKAIRGYIHVQTVPANVWTVVHNLGKPVAVTIVDSGGSVVCGDERVVDLNTVELTFSAGFAGKCYVV